MKLWRRREWRRIRKLKACCSRERGTGRRVFYPASGAASGEWRLPLRLPLQLPAMLSPFLFDEIVRDFGHAAL